jgi:uncharacterized lipoprotein YajG
MKTRHLVILAATLVLLSGCTLDKQVPKATISFNPKTKALDISSHKDVAMTNVWIKIDGKGKVSEVSIGSYTASANVDVVRSAVSAQKQQIEASLSALNAIISAASGIPPVR